MGIVQFSQIAKAAKLGVLDFVQSANFYLIKPVKFTCVHQCSTNCKRVTTQGEESPFCITLGLNPHVARATLFYFGL